MLLHSVTTVNRWLAIVSSSLTALIGQFWNLLICFSIVIKINTAALKCMDDLKRALVSIQGEAWEVKLEPTELQDSSWLGNLKYDYDSSAISQEAECPPSLCITAHPVTRPAPSWPGSPTTTFPCWSRSASLAIWTRSNPFRHNSNGISGSNSKVGMQGFVKVQNCSVIDVWQVSKLNWE